MAHVADAKKKEVAELIKLIDSYPVVAIVDMSNLPAKQLQNMRSQLRGKVILRMSKQRLIKIAFDTAKKENVKALADHLRGMPALLFSKESPFTLYKILKKNQSPAPIKAGQVAPNDIVIPAGPTSFTPGPIIGELGAFKVKAGIENGKVSVKEDAVVAKEGETVSGALAGILTRLGIEPMKIGLALTVAYENGDILKKDVLDVDEDAYKNDVKTGHGDAFKLALEIGYPTEETISPLIMKAFTESKALALEQDILAKEVIDRILAKADAQATALNSRLPT